jgi:hypothetical protein
VKPAAALDRSRELMFVWLKAPPPQLRSPSALPKPAISPQPPAKAQTQAQTPPPTPSSAPTPTPTPGANDE